MAMHKSAMDNVFCALRSKLAIMCYQISFCSTHLIYKLLAGLLMVTNSSTWSRANTRESIRRW